MVLLATAASLRLCQTFEDRAVNVRTEIQWFQKNKQGNLYLTDEFCSARPLRGHPWPQAFDDDTQQVFIKEDSSLASGELTR